MRWLRHAALSEEDTPAKGGGGAGGLGLAQLFVLFFKAGCAFGGGLGILAVLEDELVIRRRLISRQDLLSLWGIGRVVPCGTMTAVTVALAHRFCGHLGVIAALVAVILPGFVCTVALTAAYGLFAHGPVLDYIGATLLPSALAFIVIAGVRLGREIFRPSLELVLAVAAFLAAVLFDLSPTLLMILGGVIGAVFLRQPKAAP